MPGPIQEDNGRRSVTCERCNSVWWVDYLEATKLMQQGRAWIKHRQERDGETAFLGGTLKSVPYLAGLCENCDRGIMRPSVEWESAHIAQRARHFFRLVDPEMAISYAIEEYEAEFRRKFQPDFARWLEEFGQEQPHPFDEVDFSLLPEAFLGDEAAYVDGRKGCTLHYEPPNWEAFNNQLGGAGK